MMHAEIASSSQNTESSRRDLYLTPIHTGTKQIYLKSLEIISCRNSSSFFLLDKHYSLTIWK